MIRICTEADREEIMNFISKKPAENLFLIGDIEVYGFDSDIQKVWGQFKGDKLVAILLRYDINHIIYSEGPYDVEGFAEIINAHVGRLDVSGLQHVVKQIRPYIRRTSRRDVETYYAKCEQLAYSIEGNDYSDVLKLVAVDYEENVDMLKSIPEFINGNFSVEARVRAEKDKTGRTYIIRDSNGVMVCSASSTAENSQSAMIVGVGTRPGYEKRGYATHVMEKLCSDLHKEGKSICLFYSNPKAGAIYKRLGFEDIGMWSLIGYNEE
jgi:uncharacterized protein